MIIYTSARRRITLGQELNRGGEATIYEVDGQGDSIAKVYSASRDGYEQKLSWMVANPPDDPNQAIGHPSIAWPRELVYDGRNRFVGYLMPRIRGAVSLLEVFNPRRRAQTLPNFNWKYLHRAARNLASALDALHARDYVVGDLNESNILVMPTALITLIDTDSFQVQAQQLYPCPVGKAEYTAPELQRRALKGVRRQPEHDNFALGVLIFQMLMEGSHPFRSRWLQPSDPPPLEERILRGWFPYAPSGPVAPPRNVLTLDDLHPKVAELVRRCFIDGHQNPQQRPSPAEWKRVLEEAERNLIECRAGHYYANHLRECPWCIAQRSGQQVPLPPLSTSAQTTPRSTKPSTAPRPRRRQQRPSATVRIPPAIRLLINLLSVLTPSPAIGMSLSTSMQWTFKVFNITGSVIFVLGKIIRSIWGLDTAALAAAVTVALRGGLAGILRTASLVGSGMVVGALWAMVGTATGADALSVALNGLLLGAAIGALPGAIFGAHVGVIRRYGEVGGAVLGAIGGGVLGWLAEPLMLSNGLGWMTGLAVGAIVGMAFAVVRLGSGAQAKHVFGLVRQAMNLAITRLQASAGWGMVGRGLLAGGVGGMMAWWVLGGTPIGGALVGALVGFIAGVMVGVDTNKFYNP